MGFFRKEQEAQTNTSCLEEPTMVENGDFLKRNPTMAKKEKTKKR